MRRLNYLLTIGIGVLIFMIGSCKKDNGSSSVSVTGVTLNPTAVVTVGGTQVLSAVVSPNNATNTSVVWTSSNNAVATVNNAGVVSGVSAGIDTITVTTVSQGKKAKCVVTVNNKFNPNLSGTLTKSLTLLKDSSYLLVGNLTLPKGDTLTIQPGVKVKVTGNYSFNISGNLVCVGTSSDPILLTTSFSTPVPDYGYWGGFQCDSFANVTIKYTQINWAGGPAADGSTQPAVYVGGTQLTNYGKFVIIENNWFYDSYDDGVYISGQVSFSIKRNVMQHMGSPDGETFKIKYGPTGDVAYNYVWSAANNCIKITTGSNLPQTAVNVFNNTFINGGWRKVGETTQGILVDDNAVANVYNNIIIGCQNGIDITSASDYTNCREGNNLVYMIGFSDSLLNVKQTPYNGQVVANSTDLVDSGKVACASVITKYDPTSAQQDFQANVYGTDYDIPSLLATSAAKGKGTTTLAGSTKNPGYYSPKIPGATSDVLDIDLGAYTTDGKGNTSLPSSAIGQSLTKKLK